MFFLFVLDVLDILAYFRAVLMMSYCFHKNSTLGKHSIAECWGTQLTLQIRSRWKFCDGVFVQSRNLFKINMLSNGLENVVKRLMNTIA